MVAYRGCYTIITFPTMDCQPGTSSQWEETGPILLDESDVDVDLFCYEELSELTPEPSRSGTPSRNGWDWSQV